MTTQPSNMQEFANAGILGPMATKDASGDTGADAPQLSPEMAALTKKMATGLKAMQDKHDEFSKGAVTKADFDAFAAKANADLDKMEKAVIEATRTARVEAAGEDIDAKDASLVAEFKHFQGESVFPEEVTPDMVKEAADHRRLALRVLRRGDARLSEDEVKSLHSGSDPDGGFYIPTTMSRRVIEKMHETTAMRQLATVEVTNGDTWEIMNDRDFVAARWVDDASAHEQSKTPRFGTTKVQVHNLQAMPSATQNVLEDSSINLESWLANKVAIGFGLAEATAFVRGNGVGKPKGILAYEQVEYAKAKDKDDADWGKLRFVKSGNATGFGDKVDAFVDLVTATKAQYRPNARFMLERTSLGKVRTIKDADGRFLLDPAVVARGQTSIMGFPIVEGDDLDMVGAGNIPVLFGDFRQGYTIVQRRGIRVLRDPYTVKPRVQFDHTMRVGGAMVDFDAIRAMRIAA